MPPSLGVQDDLDLARVERPLQASDPLRSAKARNTSLQAV